MIYESIYKDAFEFYNKILNSEEGKKGLDYLKTRGFNLDFLNKYQIGFSNSENNDYNNALSKYLMNKYDPLEVVKSKIVKIIKEKSTIEDKVGKQRVVFPIYGLGKPTGISARSIFEDVKPRYKSICYNGLGIYNSDVLSYSPKIVYLCEGAIDCLSLEMMGLNSIGILGVQNFGMDHAKYFENFKGEVVITLDNDEPGRNSLDRVGKILSSFSIEKIYYKFLTNEQEKIDLNDLLVEYGPNIAKLRFLQIKPEPLILKPIDKKQNQIKYEKISENTIDIYKIISTFLVDLKQESGGRFRCRCPFHDEKTPSFVIESSKNYYKCYGCGKFGGPIRFIMDYLNLDYRKALEKIKELV